MRLNGSRPKNTDNTGFIISASLYQPQQQQQQLKYQPTSDRQYCESSAFSHHLSPCHILSPWQSRAVADPGRAEQRQSADCRNLMSAEVWHAL